MWVATASLLLLPATTQPDDTVPPDEEVGLVSSGSRGPTVHSSDGVRGPNRADVTRQYARLGAPLVEEVGWTVAPGLEYSRWTACGSAAASGSRTP